MRKLLLIALPCIIGIFLLASCKRLVETPPSSENGAGESASTGTSEESGQTDGSTTSADKLDVCSRLTREEVEAALDKSVAEPVPGPPVTSRRAGTVTSSCMFGSGEGFVSLDIKRQDITSKTIWNAAKAYEELKDLIVRGYGAESSGRLEEVSGVGMSAFAETKEEAANYKSTELRVLSTRSILTVRVVGSSATPTLEAAKTLAGKAITRQEKYERETAVSSPDVTASAPEPAANLGEDGSSRVPEKSQAERENRNLNPSPAQRGTSTTPAEAVKSNARRAAESRSKERRKPVRTSAKRTVERTKKVMTKRSNPRRRS